MKNKIDMSAFAGKDFDCYYTDYGLGGWENAAPLEKHFIAEPEKHDQYVSDTGHTYPLCRPRFNRKHVLDDYSWFPDGLVLRAQIVTDVIAGTVPVTPEHLKNTELIVRWVEVIGVEPDYQEQAEEWGRKVIGVIS